jgi:hypothetical protein
MTKEKAGDGIMARKTAATNGTHRRDPAYAGGFARTLLAGERARLGGHEFCIANLRELNGREVPTVMAVYNGFDARESWWGLPLTSSRPLCRETD